MSAKFIVYRKRPELDKGFRQAKRHEAKLADAIAVFNEEDLDTAALLVRYALLCRRLGDQSDEAQTFLRMYKDDEDFLDLAAVVRALVALSWTT